MLYGTSCRADSAGFKDTGSPIAVTSNTVQATVLSQHGDGYYNGGDIKYVTAEGLLEQRTIVTQVANLATFGASIIDLDSTMSFDVYAGCDRTTNSCDTRFGNLVNYGGFPYVPSQTPFGGTAIY